MNERHYETAEVKIIVWDASDILTVSGGTPIDLWNQKPQTIGWNEPVIT